MLVVGACYGGCCCLWVVATVGACFAVTGLWFRLDGWLLGWLMLIHYGLWLFGLLLVLLLLVASIVWL